MPKFVTISYTPLDAPGGVPRFNRDLHSFLPNAVHYSWKDALPAVGGVDRHDISEWDKAHVLNQWLIWSNKISKDDIIIVDGFWGLGLQYFPNVISVSHGNWSHTTKEDVEKGILPEFPYHHAVQLKYRRDHLARKGRIVAVSDFIAHQCKIQWDMDMQVLNNGIDCDRFKPAIKKIRRKRPVIIHGTTTVNKGFDHIEILKHNVSADILLLDEAANFFNCEKYDALAQADLVVHPSAHEGNSYFVLETLASGVPIISYDVGLMYKAKLEAYSSDIGKILARSDRSPMTTYSAVKDILLELDDGKQYTESVRNFALHFSDKHFAEQWKLYLNMEFDDANL